MKTTIDSAGRLVVPKALRAQLKLRGGEELEICARDGRLEIEVAPTPMHLEDAGDGPIAVPDEELPPLTEKLVRETLDNSRR